MPLIPFLVTGLEKNTQFFISASLAALMFFAIGAMKSVMLSKSAIRSGMSTLLTGGTAAALAFFAGYALREILGTVFL